MNISEKFLQAENRFGDRAKELGVSDSIIARLIEVLSTGKGKTPFLIETGHHTVKLENEHLQCVDIDERPIAQNPGIQASFELGILAHHLRTTKNRSVKLIISLSNLHHTQGSSEARKYTEYLANQSDEVQKIVDQFKLDLGSVGNLVIPDISLVTQSEATRKARNRIRAILSMYDGNRVRVKEIFDKNGYMLLHGVAADGIEVISMVTKSSIGDGDLRIQGGVPLLMREDTDHEWETQCGPTVTGIQHLILEKIGKNNADSRILTIDDFTDHQIGIKSARGIHLIDVFTGRDIGEKSMILTHKNHTPILLTQDISGSSHISFEDALETQSEYLLKQGYETIYLYKETIPIKRGGVLIEGLSHCDRGLCSISKK